MGAHDGAVDHRIFVVSLCSEVLEHPLPDAGAGPAAEAPLHLDAVSKTLRQVTPGDPGSIPVEHSLHKQPVVPRCHPDRTRTARQKVSDPLPLVVSQAVASHRSAPNALTGSEPKIASRQNLLNDDTPYLIGLKAPHPSLFRDIPWSTSDVYRLTV